MIGIQLQVGLKQRSPFTLSLDRIDSTKGYVPDNIRVVCLLANVAMNNWGIEPVAAFAEALLRLRGQYLCAQTEPTLQVREQTNDEWRD